MYGALTLLVEVGIVPRLAKRAQRAWRAGRAARGAGYQLLGSGEAQQQQPGEVGVEAAEDEDVREERQAIQVGPISGGWLGDSRGGWVILVCWRQACPRAVTSVRA